MAGQCKADQGHFVTLPGNDSLGRGRDPLVPQRAPHAAEDRFWAKVEKRPDACWLWTAGRFSNGYGCFRVGPAVVKVHRFSYELAHGPIPTGMQVDHTCRNRQCVNPEHLRLATNKQNAENRGIRKGSGSGVRGVRWVERLQKWESRVTHNGTDVYLGVFGTRDEAERAARDGRNRRFTHNELDRDVA